MKFTKILVIFLALSMLLVSCNGVGNGAATSEPDGSTSEPDTTVENPDTSVTPPEQVAKNDFERLNVTQAYPFSEGLAFIRVDGRPDELQCINMAGNVVFTVTNPHKGKTLSVIADFYNGLAVLDVGLHNKDPNDVSVIICRNDGSLVDPSVVGGDTFVFHPVSVSEDIFRDGYLIVRKNAPDSTKRKYLYSIVDHDLEMVLDCSEEFTILFEHYVPDMIYYGDHLYLLGVDEHNIRGFSIKTGEHFLKDQIAEVFISSLKRPTDRYVSFWMYSSSPLNRRYYDITDWSKVLLSFDDSLNVRWCYAFNEYGYAPIILEEEKDDGTKYYSFTVTDGNGEFAFDPIAIKEGLIYSNDDYVGSGFPHSNNIFLLHARNDNDLYAVAFDQNGIIGELELEIEDVSYFNVSLSNGIVLVEVRDWNGNYSAKYYTTDFTKIL